MKNFSSVTQASNFIALGDFNITLSPNEISDNKLGWTEDIKAFKRLVDNCCLVDLRYIGEQFTWCNRRYSRDDFSQRKLDRALVNQEWLDKFNDSFAHFQAPGISDHSPIVVHVKNTPNRKGRAFKFYNFWTSLETYPEIVERNWNKDVTGTAQYQICQKLKFLKKDLKIFGKLYLGKDRIVTDLARDELKSVQTLLSKDHSNPDLIKKEKNCLIKFHETIDFEEATLKQKSRIQWLESGDKNSRYFHLSIKARRHFKRITSLEKPDGRFTTTSDEAKEEAVRYFQSLLGTTSDHNYPGKVFLRSFIHKRVPSESLAELDRLPSDIEIKNAFFSLHSNKAPGPDGFNAHFFKDSWSLIGSSIIEAVAEFFRSGDILRELNNTIVALIPKIPNPTKMGDFRPISCCNTVYKCISKIIASRIKSVLPDLVDQAQSAFVQGRKISDNILLAQDLLRDYHKPTGKPSVTAKVDIMKAYDSVSWKFMIDLLEVLHFPPNLIKWIKACLTTPKYSLNFNGESVGFFAGAKGLRQGDPISPYLFVLVMDTLSQLLHHNISTGNFTYHRKCEKLKISHLCFADDLLILFNGDENSATIISQTLKTFYELTGL